MNKEFFKITRVSGTHNEYVVEHNCNGNIGFTSTEKVTSDTARLLEYAILEGRRQIATELRMLLEVE